MSCLFDLYKTYEANKDFIGNVESTLNGKSFTLLPLSHTTQTAHIEVIINEDGSLNTAHVIEDKSERDTVIPCTEASANRAGSKIAPYPLHDKLSYVAGDLSLYVGRRKPEDEAKTKKKYQDQHTNYIKQLMQWADSPYALPQVKSIYAYLKKNCLTKDLIERKVLWLNHNGKLIEKWEKGDEELCGGIRPAIFSAATGGQESAFVRFAVYSKDKLLLKPLLKPWEDKELYASFINFYRDQLSHDKLCYITGQKLPATTSHANKIRSSGDKAKLISANDDTGFTFRGRFTDSEEAATISYEASQKAHNALKWLIRRQGKNVDGRVFLVWSIDNQDLPDPNDDLYDLSKFNDSEETVEKSAYTNQEFAEQFKKAMAGYRSKLDHHDNVHILIIDSATTGRLGILYYRSMQQNIYFQRLIDWHSQCVWEHVYKRGKDKSAPTYFGAPATIDIAYAVCGSKANKKVIKEMMERLLPCIIDERRLPKDILRSCYYRAIRPEAAETQWEWERTLSITCALVNRQEYEQKKRGFTVALDENQTDRNYLFGRLLAIADVLEHRARQSEDWRLSNAMRYMNEFSKHPQQTWQTIQSSLIPYQAKLGRKGVYLSQLIDDISAKFDYDQFNNKPLNGKYLLGLYSQRHQLYQKKKDIVSA
ncbi:MAG: type I-C CRISPR-associated protein Cas8c/Csd1 [Sporolactobacillus sp.]|jgi:CRISPR-associated protein Csd1|nr:type I-C CRISPR-associated protein Cas8c/Csd1 [Sporolactobacillus sp.]